MVRSFVLLAASVSFAALVFAGCGGSACEDAGTALCKRAAACSGDGKARFLTPADPSGTSFASITFDSEGACDELYQYACGQQGSATVDFGACEAAAEKAPCGDSSDGKGVVSPDACNSSSN